MTKKRTTRNTKRSITKKGSTSTLPLNIEVETTSTVSTLANTTFPEIPSVVIDDLESEMSEKRPSSTTEDQNSALKTLLTSNDLVPLFATFFKAMVSSISAESAEKLMNTDPDHSNTTPSNNNRLATLFINESKVLFLRIRKPPPELILTLARECARHLEITELDANKAKQKGCGWFATWRVRLYNECTELAFSFLDNYNVSMDDLPNSSHLRNFLSWNALKSYLAEVTLTMIHYFVCKNIDRNRYNNSTKGQRAGWRNAMLSDLHSLDRITIDIRVISESG
ncbi:22744_t:CDS:2, partial [Rhizophagus irregularis]